MWISGVIYIMNERCSICFDEDKRCNHICKGDDCPKAETCHRRIAPIVRITRKCTQSCRHCCFECSPEEKEMMTVETASKIRTFFEKNNIVSVNIMGGEFFCNPEWYDVCSELVNVKDLMYARITSNGDWAGSKKVADKVVKFCKKYPKAYVALSKDKWHTNQHFDKAVEILEKNDIIVIKGKGQNNDEDSIVPIGNAKWEYNLYVSFSVYCHKPDCRYKMMIDETGELYKCPMGIWEFDNVDNFQGGGFSERFKEFYSAFYKAFFGNCKNCLRSYHYNMKKTKASGVI